MTASADRPPDSNGWYNHALSIQFSGGDDTSGIASCTNSSYSGPDTDHTSVPGSCTDRAGNTQGTGFELKYDATPPSVEGKPDRPPNAKGWYNRAVTVAFVGSDALSGIESCVPPVVYKGPDVPTTSLSGSCRDNAANTSPPAVFALRYDTKPPSLKRVKAEIGSSKVVLRWSASKDTFSFSVVRRPGLKGRKPSTVYGGRARTFTDRRIRSGVKYRYTITAYDEAGNGTAKGLLVRLDISQTTSVGKPTVTKSGVPRPALTRPANGARLSAPPVLAWTAVPKATYYNVQLYRNGRKILSTWPSSPRLQVPTSWRYEGVTYALTPGRYRWYVWPGLGPRSANRYGRLLGARDFVVTR